MKDARILDDQDVAACLAAATAEARNNGWKVAIAVTDTGGHLLGYMRLDGTSPMSGEIAQAKARTAALSRRETRFFEQLLASGRTAFLSVNNMTILEGGIPILVDGVSVGGIGVSGVLSEQDAQVAFAGAAALQAHQA